MRQEFTLHNGVLTEAPAGTGDITFVVGPTDEERQWIEVDLQVPTHTLDGALDPEEISRLELDPRTKRATIIWKRPDPAADVDAGRYEVASVGIFLDPDRLTVVLADGAPPIGRAAMTHVRTPLDLVLRMMAATVEEFIGRLRTIKWTAGEIQGRLNRSLDNRELVRMFDLSEDIAYYVDAIEGNGAVMNKIRAAAGRIGLSEDEAELLDDLIIDNDQCRRQGHIYSDVLGGLLDARGNIVNNNMNVLLKNLTLINVIFLPLAVIASMGGMSEFTEALDHNGIDWRLGYPLFALGMGLLGLLLWRVLGSWINRVMSNGR